MISLRPYMLRFGGGAPAPAIQQSPPPPTPTDPNVLAAQQAQAVSAAQAAGRASTILTSGLGDTSTPALGTTIFKGLSNILGQ